VTSAVAAAPTPPEDSYASMIRIIANPEKFDGKRVVVFGFVDFEREANLLFTDKERYDNVILTDALWVESSEQMGKSKDSLNLKYVRIDGTFRTGSKGRFQIAVGGITDIRSCTPWSDPTHPSRDKIRDLLQPGPLPRQ